MQWSIYYSNNNDEILSYLKKVSDRGDIYSMYNYGITLLENPEYQEFQEEAVKYIKISAISGNPYSMELYGEMLISGSSIVPFDLKEGINFIKMAIDEDNEEAMYQYGKLLINGEGVETDIEEDIKYFKMAIEKGSSNAMFEYGSMLLSGFKVTQDFQEGIKYIIKATINGNQDALNFSSVIMKHVTGRDVSFVEIIKIFSVAENRFDTIFTGSFQNIELSDSLIADLPIPTCIKEVLKENSSSISSFEDIFKLMINPILKESVKNADTTK